MADFEDISQETEVWDESPSQLFKRPADVGIYAFTVQAEGFKAGEFTSAGEECAYFRFRAQINGGPFDGRLAFGMVSTMKPRLEGQVRSTLQDFVLSAGSTLRPTPSQMLAEVRKNSGDNNAFYSIQRVVGPFTGKLDWEWSVDDETFLKGGKKPKSPKKYKGPAITVRRLPDGSVDHIQIGPGGQEVCATPIIRDYIVKAKGAVTVHATTQVAAADLPPSAG